MDYDSYIDRVAEQLDVDAFNLEELKIIEGCFERKWEINIAADLIKAHWTKEEENEESEEDYNMHGDYN